MNNQGNKIQQTNDFNKLLYRVDKVLSSSISSNSEYISFLLENEDLLISLLDQNTIGNNQDNIIKCNQNNTCGVLDIIEKEQENFKKIIKGLLEMISIQKEHTSNIVEQFELDRQETIDIQSKLIAENEELTKDPITGAGNLQGLISLLSILSNNKELLGQKNITLLNISNFDEITNKYGYSGGNTILKFFANYIKKFLGENIDLYRLEGDNFIIVADNNKKIETLLEKFLLTISNTNFKSSTNKSISFNLSFNYSFIKFSILNINKINNGYMLFENIFEILQKDIDRKKQN